MSDAEFSIPVLLKTGFALQALRNLSGVAFCAGAEIERTKTEWFDRLDDIPYISSYFVKRHLRPITLLTARGCPFPCTFCDRGHLWGRRVRRRSIQSVVDELAMLAKTPDGREVFFGDDNFILDSAWVTALCLQILKRKIRLRWSCNSRVDAPTLELLKLMRLAGCRMIYYGVESGSAKVRRALGKKYSNQTIIKSVCLTRDAGMAVGLYMMLACPNDDARSFRESRLLLQKLAPFDSLDVNPLTLLPGSSLYEEYLSVHGKDRQAMLNQDWPFFYQADWRRVCESAKGLNKFLRISDCGCAHG